MLRRLKYLKRLRVIAKLINESSAELINALTDPLEYQRKKEREEQERRDLQKAYAVLMGEDEKPPMVWHGRPLETVGMEGPWKKNESTPDVSGLCSPQMEIKSCNS